MVGGGGVEAESTTGVSLGERNAAAGSGVGTCETIGGTVSRGGVDASGGSDMTLSLVGGVTPWELQISWMEAWRAEPRAGSQRSPADVVEVPSPVIIGALDSVAR
jgi:hypothetical protein